MSSDDIAISVRNLTKTYRIFGHPGDRLKQAMTFGMRRYHREFTALKDVSFDINKGKTVGIIGRNGSGKSTLLQLICGILKPTSGSVTVNGRISALLELGSGFNPEFTGRENVYFHGALIGLSTQDINVRFDNIARFADIGSFIDQPVRMYSNGMFVRLAFAAAIYANPDILVVDEALAVGDEEFQRKCLEYIEENITRKMKTLLLVSHNTRQIERICSYALLIEDGRVVDKGTPVHVCGTYHTKVNQISTGATTSSTAPRRVRKAPDFDLIDIHLTDAGGQALKLIMADQLAVVRCRYRFNRPLVSPTFGIGIHTLDFINLATENSQREFAGTTMSAGIHELTCSLGPLPFRSGTYAIRLGITTGILGEVIYYGENLYTFEFISPHPYARSPATDGYVALNPQWLVTPDLAALP